MARNIGSANEGFFYWAARDAWVCDQMVDGKQRRVTLAKGEKNKAAARKTFLSLNAAGGVAAFARAKQAPQQPQQGLIIEELTAGFLNHKTATKPADTVTTYRNCLSRFRRDFGNAVPDTLTVADVEVWAAERKNVVNVKKAIKNLLNWSVENRGLAKNPLAKMETGKILPRITRMTAQQMQDIADKATPRFRDFWNTLVATGARPGEIGKITAENLTDIQTKTGPAILAQFFGKTSAKKKRLHRIIFRNGTAKLIRQLAAEHPTGPLFMTDHGGKWSKGRWGYAFDTARTAANLSGKFVIYSARHTYITNALKAGVPVPLLAKACNTSARMILEVYDQTDDDDVAESLALLD